jgi:hypothetical protein
MTCSDTEEVDQVGRHLAKQNTGRLATYLRTEDLLLNEPAGPVALFILATDDPAPVLRRRNPPSR